MTCQLVNLSPVRPWRSRRDTLLYMLSCDRLKALCRESRSFGEHFSATVKDRLRPPVTTTQESDDPAVAAMMVEIGSLILGPDHHRGQAPASVRPLR